MVCGGGTAAGRLGATRSKNCLAGIAVSQGVPAIISASTAVAQPSNIPTNQHQRALHEWLHNVLGVPARSLLSKPCRTVCTKQRRGQSWLNACEPDSEFCQRFRGAAFKFPATRPAARFSPSYDGVNLTGRPERAGPDAAIGMSTLMADSASAQLTPDSGNIPL